MFISTKDCILNMSAPDFERFSLYTLKQQTKGLDNLEFQHNVIMEQPDGSYQIDGIIRFDVMGVRYTTLVECKHYKGPITREKVQVLYDKLRALGAHKGILIATSNFQSGALKYAKEHGIALIQITDAETNYEVRGRYHVIQNRPNLYNRGVPYIGIMQVATDSGISCRNLNGYNESLKDFLLEVES